MNHYPVINESDYADSKWMQYTCANIMWFIIHRIVRIRAILSLNWDWTDVKIDRNESTMMWRMHRIIRKQPWTTTKQISETTVRPFFAGQVHSMGYLCLRTMGGKLHLRRHLLICRSSTFALGVVGTQPQRVLGGLARAAPLRFAGLNSSGMNVTRSWSL